MLLARLVIEQRFFRRALLQRFLGDGCRAAFVHFAVEHGHLQRRKRHPGIPVGKDGNHPQQLFFHLHLLAPKPARIFERAGKQRHNFFHR